MGLFFKENNLKLNWIHLSSIKIPVEMEKKNQNQFMNQCNNVRVSVMYLCEKLEKKTFCRTRIRCRARGAFIKIFDFLFRNIHN